MLPVSTRKFQAKRKSVLFLSISCLFHVLAFSQPANDLCVAAVPIQSHPTCVNTAGTLTAATNTPFTNNNNTKADVWYSFTAQSLRPTINLSGSVVQVGFQLLNGTCGSFSNVTSGNIGSAGTSYSKTSPSNLVIGNVYYIRVYSNNNSTGSFDICVTDGTPPANNVLSSAVSILPETTCLPTSSSLYNTSLTTTNPTISNDCATGASSDIWFKFVPPTPTVSVSLSNLGAGLTGAGIEILTGNATSAYALACGSSTASATSLFVGTTYYIRVFHTGSAPVSYAAGSFDLCITYNAITTAPSNDECANAVNLVVKKGCGSILGTMNGATLSSGIPSSCGSGNYDVWYMFNPINNDVTSISLSSLGSNFGTAGLELYSGSCGSLTSIACGTTTVAAPLTAGNTYYVRVFSSTGTTAPGFGDFKICASSATAPPRISASYVNLTKKSTGGVVEPGDTLEIRMAVALTSGNIYNARYLSNIPTYTSMLAGSTDSIRVITNEGLTYRNYTVTDGVNDDAGTYLSAPGAGEYNIRLNLGQDTVMPSAPAFNTLTDVTGAGGLKSTDRPRGGGGLLFATSYRVVVTGSIGDIIVTDPGYFVYKNEYGGADTILSARSFNILISEPLTICDNNFGVNNASEFGGSFGSGSSLNRSTDLSQTILGYSLVHLQGNQSIGDGFYGIVKNTSPISSSNSNSNRRNDCISADPYDYCNNRMFGGFWNIIGDHTGTSTATGNAPPADTDPGGYMLVVNADYATTEAYRQTLTGLCPNTWYEFSAWFQNICSVCGVDSIGQQFTGTATAPYSGYPGVYPNLSFTLDGVDRYSTGQIDTVGWTKRGFMFLTGPAQTSATLSIRNNAQGGGGNDWAMDDISVSTCFPSMSYSPTNTPQVCQNNSIQIGDTVRSQFANYNYYVWQKSVDNGASWTDVTSVQTATPVFNGTEYEYITTYNVPTSETTMADSGTIYRVYTATTLSNVSNPSCVANDGSAPITLTVNSCTPLLGVQLLQFRGEAEQSHAILYWNVSGEEGPVKYRIEKSNDARNFHSIGSVMGKNKGASTQQYYQFKDPERLAEKNWYRIAIDDAKYGTHYSNTISLGNTATASIDNLVTPFHDKISFQLHLPTSAQLQIEIRDIYGKIVHTETRSSNAGSTTISLQNSNQLAAGNYVLTVRAKDFTISRKLVKW